jgi:S1-C subfamily serine protease
MIKNIFAIIGILVVGMIGGIFASQILVPYFFPYQYDLERGPVYLTESKQIYIQENVALSSAIEKVEKVVAGVQTQTQTGKFLEGSGIIVTSDGLMVTLAELVPYNSSYSFFVDGKQVSFQILKRDLDENLALVKISDSILNTAGFAKLDKLKIGQRVFSLGIFFEEKTSLKMANEGIVKYFNENFIQTNIVESSFMAGSPLFNIEGEILGINMIDSAGRVNTIPISKIRNFIGI